jgi:hypothetical protein
MIHAVQVITVKKRYEQSPDLRNRFKDAETYYEYLLGRIIGDKPRGRRSCADRREALLRGLDDRQYGEASTNGSEISR